VKFRSRILAFYNNESYWVAHASAESFVRKTQERRSGTHSVAVYRMA